MAACREDDLHLPQEICSDILSRVPVKLILRFRSVCKSWHSLISCPNFKPKTLSDRILLNFEDRSCGVGSLTSHGTSFLESQDHNDDLPYRFCGQGVYFIGSCDGLICFYIITSNLAIGTIDYSLFIYNPAIRKIVEIPSFSLILYEHYPLHYGFGFDSKAGDYKVFLIMKDELGYVYGFMFDLRTGAWKEFAPIVPNFMHSLQEFYLNDAVYWRGWRKTDNKHVGVILSFNLSDETFRVITMPAELSFNYRITTSGGLIYALADNYSVWVMKEYGVTESWTKVFTIDVPPQIRRESSLYALIVHSPEVAEVFLGYRPRMKYAKCHKPVEHFISHNNESGESKCLLSTYKCIKNLVFYEESLVLM